MFVETPHPSQPPREAPRVVLSLPPRPWRERLCAVLESGGPGASSTLSGDSPQQGMRLRTSLRDFVTDAGGASLELANGGRLSCLLPDFVDLRTLRGHRVSVRLEQTLGDDVSCELVLADAAGEPFFWLFDGDVSAARHVPAELAGWMGRVHPAEGVGLKRVGPWRAAGRQLDGRPSLIAVRER